MEHTFIWKENDQGELLTLIHREDPYQMNWVKGKKNWGTMVTPEGIQTDVKRELTAEGRIREIYTFRNTTQFPIFPRENEYGIYTTFNDDYLETGECMTRRCHTHIFCGKNVSYVMALRMGGCEPHLGLVLTEGSISGYSVEREPDKASNDRGDFILHPDIGVLEPSEEAVIVWELFWHKGENDFYRILYSYPMVPVANLDECTYFLQENMTIKIDMAGILPESEWKILVNGEKCPFEFSEKENGIHIEVNRKAEREGEYRFQIFYGERETEILCYACPNLDVMTERRVSFIVKKQQYLNTESHLYGAYLIYDRETESMYYSHRDDHNGGRERLAMGILTACWLQKHPDPEKEGSLQKYVEYVYRELYDRTTGTVYNDICHNNDWNRLYNYPWMAVFQIELYKLYHREDYLKDAFQTMKQYYEIGGSRFYGICIPAAELYQLLTEAHLTDEAETFLNMFQIHADKITENGNHYPESEVQYEQSIVSPAASIELQAYQISKKECYLKEAEQQLEVLKLFNAHQPDYFQFENGIRHWDGYWFGKYENYGDTYPHYWSMLTGVAYAIYSEITGDITCKKRARASLRGCLNLFFPDGWASCAMVYPKTITGVKGFYYDPWANDQDWALYYAYRYKELVED